MADRLNLLNRWNKMTRTGAYLRSNELDAADGKYIGAFYGKARRYISDSTFNGVSNIRDTALTFECREFLEESPVKFFSGITIPVTSVLHAPSGRVTVFDANSGTYDNPQFNLPMVVDVHFDSIGMMSYKNAGSRVIGPPYVTNRYLSDVIAMLPSNAKLYRRNGIDGLEIRFSQVDQRDLGEGKKFQATTSALVTYKPSRD